MMGYQYGGMLGSGIGVVGTITWIVIVIDLALLGMWLWKQVKK